MAIANRKEQIDFLLRREFGSLAPPPAPTLASKEGKVRAALDKAVWERDLRLAGKSDQQSGIERRREEYEAADAAQLQSLVDDAKAEDARKVQEWLATVQATREQRWPHWAQKDLWSEAEFAALCCGLVPDERGMPGDPGKVAGDHSHAVAILRATDDIRRGTLSRTLSFVPRDDEDTASRMYGTARHYVPKVAAEWAATRARAFPSSLLTAVRERAPMAAEHITPASPWPWGGYETELLRKLAAAADKHWKLYDPADPSTAPTNDDVVKWLKGQGVAKRNAEVMATILRADGLPTGPRK